MAIYRGTGGAGDSTTDATVSDVTEQATIASTKASEAAASATSAATSASQAASSATSAANSAANAATAAASVTTDAAAAEAAKLAAQAAQAAAELAETGAETAETNAETAETNAASSASAASTSATNAANSASSAATSASNASTSASAAATSATDAATSASSAATSATSAATSAGTATTQATAAAASAASASNSATAAASSASAASTSATNAATSETNAATSAANASTSETNASASETAAAGSAASASTSASNAATSATSASNSASSASTSATNAASSATAAAGSASAASASADAALAALDNFDDRYLGQKASAPTVDNDGDPLVTGALYFDTTDDAMKVWDGTQWLNAYASLSGALIANNNLSDLTNAATARTNLGLGTAATTDSTAYATAAQGALADAALPASSYTAADVLTKVKTVDGSGSGLDADLLDGQQGTYYAAASSLSNYLPLSGGAITGDATFGDNNKATFGASADLQIYHSGSHSYIKDSGTGNLYLEGQQVIIKGNSSGQWNAIFADGGDSIFYHSNVGEVARTKSTGIDVTGTVTADGLTVDGLAQISAQTNGTYALRVGDAAGSSGSVVGIGKIGINPQGAGAFTYTGTEIRATENAVGDYRAALSFYTRGDTSDVEPLKRLDIANNGDISFYEDTGTTAKFFWDASLERLGIGTSSPGDKLHVEGNIYLGASSRTVYTGGSANLVFQTNTGSHLFLRNNGASESMRIDSSGNVFVGKTLSSLNTTGIQLQNDGLVRATKSGAAVLQLNRQSSDGSIAEFYKDGATVGGISNSGTLLNINGTGGLTFSEGGAEAMRITSAGNVGIGTSSPATALDVNGQGSLKKTYAYGAANYHIKLNSDYGSGISSYIANIASANRMDISVGGYYFGGGLYQLTDGATGMATINIDENGTFTYQSISGATANSTVNPAERMRIDSAGNLLVGKTSSGTTIDGVELIPQGAIYAVRPNNVTGVFNRRSSDGDILHFRKDGTTIGSISVTASTTSYNTSSDQRLKENIADADDAGSKIDAIKVRQYDWKADGSHQDYGMIAQELQLVAPEAVSGDAGSEEMMGVDYSKLVPMLIKEIQSLRNRVAQLEV